VLVSDFLLKGVQLLVTVDSMSVLAEATNTIAAGEVMQLMGSHDPEVDEARYLEVIRRKTAKLFEAAAQIGAVLGGADAASEDALARYGMKLGTAFQLIDDVLDYSGDLTAIGKNLGDDLAEGKPTLPRIRALQVGSAADTARIRGALSAGRIDEFEPVLEVLARSGALDYTRRCAEVESAEAAGCLGALSDSPARATLLKLSAFAVTRTF
jgi:octaprenyl-diphosphate synthase